MIQRNGDPQNRNSMAANKMYFKTLNQTGCECFENATSSSLFKILLSGILKSLEGSTLLKLFILFNDSLNGGLHMDNGVMDFAIIYPCKAFRIT